MRCQRCPATAAVGTRSFFHYPYNIRAVIRPRPPDEETAKTQHDGWKTLVKNAAVVLKQYLARPIPRDEDLEDVIDGPGIINSLDDDMESFITEFTDRNSIPFVHDAAYPPVDIAAFADSPSRASDPDSVEYGDERGNLTVLGIRTGQFGTRLLSHVRSRSYSRFRFQFLGVQIRRFLHDDSFLLPKCPTTLAVPMTLPP